MQRIREKLQEGLSVRENVRQFIRIPFTKEEEEKLEQLLGEIYK